MTKVQSPVDQIIWW